jgi:aromatic ring-opening dioxygenase LigB subunit
VIVFACIAPHGDMDLDPELRGAMEELGRRFDAANPDVAIVVTPHNVHVQQHFAVITAAHVGEWEVDGDTADALLGVDLPILGVSYGGNVREQSEMPLDWGTEVPLDFMRAQRVVVVAPARDRPLEEHLRLGREIASNNLLQATRIALIASADHGHTHTADGPYGFHLASAAYDDRLLEILASGRLDFLPLAELVEDAKADSLWQLLVLQGALGEGARADLLAYARRSYFGMLVAEVSA